MSVFWASGDLITNLQVLTVMVLGVVFAVEGRITLGEFIAFLSYNASLTWPVRSLGRIISDMSKAGVSMERVAYILEAEEEDATDANNKPALTGDICFRNVSFAYSLDHPILKNINFTIPAGSTFAILGTTGSGKSTLVHLLNRLYDLPEGCGSITIGGTDIRDIDRQYLRQNIGNGPSGTLPFFQNHPGKHRYHKGEASGRGNPPRSGNCLRGRIPPAFYRRLRHHCGMSCGVHLIRRSEAASGNCPHADESRLRCWYLTIPFPQ